MVLSAGLNHFVQVMFASILRVSLFIASHITDAVFSALWALFHFLFKLQNKVYGWCKI